MLVSKEEFIKQATRKSNLLGNRVVLAHHQSKKIIVGTVVNQDKYSIKIQPISSENTFHLYYGSYHILEWLD